MKLTKVKLKNGDSFVGVLWTWRPREGYMDITGDDVHGTLRKLFLRDVESAIEEKVMVRYNLIKDVDLLERAKEEGWDGT